MGRRQFILTIASLLALFGNYAKLSLTVIVDNSSDIPLTYSVVTKAVDAETEAKTEEVYLKTEAQGSLPILLTVLSSGAVLAQKF